VLYPAVYSILIFIVPFFLAIFHGIFGSEFILFAWVDDLLVFLITHWVSNVTPLIHIGAIIYFVTYMAEIDTGVIGWEDAFFSCMIVVEALTGYFATQRTMKSSGDANRYLNPQWNFIPRGAKLYPTILYLLGIKKRKVDGSETNSDEHKQEHQEEMAISLMTDF